MRGAQSTGRGNAAVKIDILLDGVLRAGAGARQKAFEVAEVLVEVLFAGEHCTPGRFASRAVVERSSHFLAGLIGLSSQQGMSGGRT